MGGVVDAAAAGKQKLSPASALLGNRRARRSVAEMQASRVASVLASMLEQGRGTDNTSGSDWVDRETNPENVLT